MGDLVSDGRVHVWEGALDGEAAVLLRREAIDIAKCPNFWTPRDVLERACAAMDAGEAPDAALTSAEVAMAHLLALKRPLLEGVAWKGVEWWAQVYEPGKGLAFHFDKDEQALEERGEMRFPRWSSVLYLTGDPTDAASSQRQGPTTIIDQRLCDGEPEPLNPHACALVFPSAGQFCAFDGRLAHGVLDSGEPSPRLTLLVNWWEEQPRGISGVPGPSEERSGRAEDSDDGTSPEVSTSSQDEGGEESQGRERYSRVGGDASAASRLSRGQMLGRGACRKAGHCHVALATAFARLGDVPPEAALPVGMLAKACGARLVGESAVSVLTIAHPECVLFPLDSEQAADHGVGAVLVPASAVGSFSDTDSD